MLSHYRDVLNPGHAFVINLSVQVDGHNVRLTCQGLQDLEQKTLAQSSDVTISVNSKRELDQLYKILEKQQGGRSRIMLELKDGTTKVRMRLKGTYSLSADTKALLKRSELHLTEQLG